MAVQVASSTHIIDEVAVGLQAIEQTMKEAVISDVSILQDASRHILQAGGKRVRPRLFILSYLALGGMNVEEVAEPAAAVELMHTASVVHDDINDHGILRRGRPSINAIWGRTFALLTGDFLFTAVYKLMAPYQDLNIDLASAATALVEGETLQAEAVKNNTFTSDIYLEIIAKKTAALFQSAGVIGAKLAKATKQQVEALGQYAFNVGLAFQIVDDILDIIGDEATLGKTAGIDIEQGRGITSISTNSNGHRAEDVMDAVKRKLLEGDRLEKAKLQSRHLVNMAISELDNIPMSPYKQDLIDLALGVVNRDF